MKKEYFFEMTFRGLTLLFWTIIIYKWIFISNIYIERNAFLTFSILSILYILAIIIYQIKSKFLDMIMFYYINFTLISYIFTLASFLLFPTNLRLLWLKLSVVCVYFYISCKGVYTHKNEECVVGIISSILLFAISICY